MSLIANLFGELLGNLLAAFLGYINALLNGDLNRNLLRDVLASLLGHISTNSVGNFPGRINAVNLGNFAASGNCNFVGNLNRDLFADRNIDRPAFGGSLVAIPGVLGVVAGAIVATLTVSMSLLVIWLTNLFCHLMAIVFVGGRVGSLVILNADLFVSCVAFLVRDILVDLFALLVVDGGADVLALGLVVGLVGRAALFVIGSGANLSVRFIADGLALVVRTCGQCKASC